MSHNGQFIIFTLSSDTEGCIRELLASTMNNLSQAATCEIIQLTRIYNAGWIFLLSLGFMKHGVARDHGSPVMRLHIYFSSLFFIYLFFWCFHIILLPNPNVFLSRVQSPLGTCSTGFESQNYQQLRFLSTLIFIPLPHIFCPRWFRLPEPP